MKRVLCILCKSNDIEIMIGYETDEIIEELFNSFLQKYQKSLEESMKGSELVFDSVDLLHYKCHKRSLSRSGSNTASPKWLKNKTATINSKNNDDKCFQYAVTVTLNHKQIKSHPEKISTIKPFINQYNWKEINFPSHKSDWKKFETNSKTIALNILYIPYSSGDIRYAHISKHNSKRENQAAFLTITDNERMALFCYKKIVCTVLQNNIKAWWRLLLFELSSLI